MNRRLYRLVQILFRPGDIGMLVYYRVAFGGLMFCDTVQQLATCKIELAYMASAVQFKYPFFGWVALVPPNGVYGVVIAMMVASLLVILGWFYRAAITAFCLGYTYLFLADATNYNNHQYLICLLSFWMIFAPAHGRLSIDAWRKPSLRKDFAAAWHLDLLRVQMGLVYFFGGVAKLNADWLQGFPMRIWLLRSEQMGPLFTEMWGALLFSYGGLLFDLLIVPALLWRRTRLPGFAIAVLFHLTNSQLFSIGVFPWLAMATTVLFFPAEAPRKWLAWLRPRRAEDIYRAVKLPPPAIGVRHRVLAALLLGYIAVQGMLPLRHVLYAGSPLWTEEGHRFAWHMMLRSKRAWGTFMLRDASSGKEWRIDPYEALDDYYARKMLVMPDLVLQYVHVLAADMRGQGCEVAVYADIEVSLNGREPESLVDSKVDLAKEPRRIGHYPWILPQTEPLRRR